MTAFKKEKLIRDIYHVHPDHRTNLIRLATVNGKGWNKSRIVREQLDILFNTQEVKDKLATLLNKNNHVLTKFKNNTRNGL